MKTKPIATFLSAGLCVILLASQALVGNTKPITAGTKAKVERRILSRDGDNVSVKEKSGTVVVVVLSDSTMIARKNGAFQLRKSDQDVAATVPGLTIEASGVGNAKGQLDASKVTFTPDEFAIEVAEQQEINANRAAAKKAQSTANSGVAKANAAQSSADAAQGSANAAQGSADAAQASANQAGAAAQAAGAGALVDAAAIGSLNKGVSDLGTYKTVVEAGIYFESGKYALDDAAKADLSKLADLAMGTNGYLIEIAGYASSTGTKAENQKLSDERAAAVTNYLRSQKNVPMRRILVPAGYGANYPAAENSDSMGRALNRRVDVKVLVNKGINESI